MFRTLFSTSLRWIKRGVLLLLAISLVFLLQLFFQWDLGYMLIQVADWRFEMNMLSAVVLSIFGLIVLYSGWYTIKAALKLPATFRSLFNFGFDTPFLFKQHQADTHQSYAILSWLCQQPGEAHKHAKTLVEKQSHRHYAYLIRALTEPEHRLQLAWLDRACSLEPLLSSKPLQLNLYLHAYLCFKAQRYKTALDSLTQIQKPNAAAIELRLKCYQALNQIDDALHLIQQYGEKVMNLDKNQLREQRRLFILQALQTTNHSSQAFSSVQNLDAFWKSLQRQDQLNTELHCAYLTRRQVFAPEDVLQQIFKLLAQNLNHPAYDLLSSCQWTEAQNGEIFDFLCSITQKKPKDIPHTFFYLLSQHHQKLGEFEQAKEAIKHAIDNVDEIPSHYYQTLAEIEGELGLYQRAFQAYQLSLKKES